MIRKKIYEIGIVLYLFCGIFAPPFFSFNIIYILAGVAAVYLLCNYGVSKTVFSSVIPKKILLLMSVISMHMFFSLLLGELFGTQGLTENRIIVAYQWFFLIPAQLITCWGVSVFSRKNDISADRMLVLCVYAGLCEAVLVIIAFVNPSVRMFFFDIMLKNGGNANIYGNQELLSYRGYGFAATLLDTFGYGMALIIGIVSLGGIKIKANKVCLVMLLLFTCAINARTGLAIAAIIPLVMILDIKKISKIKRKKLFASVFCIIFIIMCSLFLYTNESIKRTKTFEWIVGGFSSVFNFVTGKDAGYTLGSMKNSMFNSRFWQVPTSFSSLLFGRGHSIYSDRKITGVSSDVGYINYIWIIGMIGTIALMWTIFLFFRKKYLDAEKKYKRLICFICLSFFVMMIKGNVITHTAGTFITIYLSAIDMRSAKDDTM